MGFSEPVMKKFLLQEKYKLKLFLSCNGRRYFTIYSFNETQNDEWAEDVSIINCSSWIYPCEEKKNLSRQWDFRIYLV